jgi:hypothetical protein
MLIGGLLIVGILHAAILWFTHHSTQTAHADQESQTVANTVESAYSDGSNNLWGKSQTMRLPFGSTIGCSHAKSLAKRSRAISF